MPITQKARLGEADRGISLNNNTDNHITVYVVAPGTRLTKATVSASRNGNVISAAELNGRAYAVVFVRQAEQSQPPNPNITTTDIASGTFGALRIIGAAWIGDARFGQNPGEIPLAYTVQEGEQIVIEVTGWADSAGTLVSSQSIVNLIGDQPSDGLSARVR